MSAVIRYIVILNELISSQYIDEQCLQVKSQGLIYC